jgi:putative ABC transport system permease protein
MRFALRQLLKNPGFTVLAVLTLALGISGSVVIFSVFNALFLRPLPFKDAERLVNLDEVAPKWNLEYTGVCYDDFVEWRAQNQTFESMGAREDASLQFFGQRKRGTHRRTSSLTRFFPTLGIQPVLGRGFSPDEDQPEKGRVALISFGLWQRLWGGSSDVLGQTLTLDAVPHTHHRGTARHGSAAAG